jgi:hypothetical protein
MKLHVLGIDLGRRSFIWLGLRRASTLLTQLAETPRAWEWLTALGGGNRRRVGSPDTECKIWNFAEVVESTLEEHFKRRRV